MTAPEVHAQARPGPLGCAASVIVPAHNEAAVLTRGLRTLLAGARPGEFDVVVVSNGSVDDTAGRARAFARDSGHPVRVAELTTASKTAALAEGARLAAADVQVVMDADVLLDTATLRALVAGLRAARQPAVAAPGIRVDTSACSPLVRGYYRAWLALPYARDGMIGSGVFGLNAAGVRRVGALPEIVNDDGWVRRSFAPAERLATEGEFTVFAPRTAGALIRRRARVAVGNRELDERLGGPDSDGNGARDLLAEARAGRLSWPDCAAYVAVTAAARALARWRRLVGAGRRWSMDQTSRREV